MSSPDNEGSNQDELANIWGSGWYKLTPKQRQLVEEIMNNFKIVKISEILEEKVYKMPFPSFVEVSDKTKAAFLFAQITPNNLTVSWQLILVEIINGLINQDYKKAFQLLFLELDYIQINRNAINDVCAVTQQSLNPNIAIKIEAKINSIKKWVSNYLHCPQDERANLNQLINEFSGLVNLLKDIEVVGIGAFVLAATLQLTIQQEKAKISSSEWSQVKNLAVEYIHYAKTVNPRLFRLSVGRIDKSCQCTKYTLKVKKSQNMSAVTLMAKTFMFFENTATV